MTAYKLSRTNNHVEAFPKTYIDILTTQKLSIHKGKYKALITLMHKNFQNLLKKFSNANPHKTFTKEQATSERKICIQENHKEIGDRINMHGNLFVN